MQDRYPDRKIDHRNAEPELLENMIEKSDRDTVTARGIALDLIYGAMTL
jgi:hypothetical protein